MLAANEAVATLLAERLPHTAFLRRHPPPTAKQIKEAQTSLKSIGVDVQIGSAGALQVPYINLTFFLQHFENSQSYQSNLNYL